MTPRSAAILACRIIALVLGIGAVTAIIGFVAVAREFSGSGPFWAFVLPTLLVAYVLWVFADRVAEQMARGTDETATVTHRLVDLQAIAFSIVGVVLVASAVPDLIGVTFASFPEFGGGLPLPFFPDGSFAGRGGAIAAALVQIAIGVGLIFGARTVAEWLMHRDRPRQLPPGEAP